MISEPFGRWTVTAQHHRFRDPSDPVNAAAGQYRLRRGALCMWHGQDHPRGWFASRSHSIMRLHEAGAGASNGQAIRWPQSKAGRWRVTVLVSVV